MLFNIAIDPLQRILHLATTHGILIPIRSRTPNFRISLYADNAGIFVNPIKEEIHAISTILDCFGKASGLITNLAKSEVFAVRCGDIYLGDMLASFPAKIIVLRREVFWAPTPFSSTLQSGSSSVHR
jgi:hypothetical protein